MWACASMFGLKRDGQGLRLMSSTCLEMSTTDTYYVLDAYTNIYIPFLDNNLARD